MKLESVYREHLNWGDNQWLAFLELCTVMGCEEGMNALLQKKYSTELAALQAANQILQTHFYRGSEHNPFGLALERYHIQNQPYTLKHQHAAKAFIKLGLHLEKAPQEDHVDADVVFVLGSIVPNMAERIEFAKEKVLSKIPTHTKQPSLFGLGSDRSLVPVKPEQADTYLGDYSADFIPATQKLLTEAQAKEASFSEAGALQYLAEEKLSASWLQHWKTLIAKTKSCGNRADTQDTAYVAGQVLMQNDVPIPPNFKVVVVSHALFSGQKEQILTGLMRAGIRLSSRQVDFYGVGYPTEVFNLPAYVQIGVSALAEHLYHLELRLEAQTRSDLKHAEPN